MSKPTSQRRRNFRRTRLCLEALEARTLMAGDLVIDWNNAIIEAQRNDLTTIGPGWSSRNFALVHLAMFDALNAITQTHSSFALQAVAPPEASKEAAMATAAHDVAVALYPSIPSVVATLDALLAQTLAAVPDGPAEDMGIAIGQLAAQAIIDLRFGDGAGDLTDYQASDKPGRWRPDPLNPEQIAWGPEWGDVTPFGMLDPEVFQVAPPPRMNSAAYTAAYNEVKSLGAIDSTTRTADQTEIGLFWAYDRGGFGPPIILYNQSVQTIAMQQGNTLEENARLFALVNLAMADTGVAVWHTKYTYDFWRPIEGIRRGDEDGNRNTIADPTWTPLAAPGPDFNSHTDDFTPPFPAYTSGHAGFGAATFKTLANFYGFDYEDDDPANPDQYDFSLVSEEFASPVTRSYDSFEQAAQENGRSRIYLGIHWEFDNQNGQKQGRAVADDIFETFLLPRDGYTMLSIQHAGSGMRTLALDLGMDLVLRRVGQQLWIIDADTRRPIAKEKLTAMQSIQIDGRNGAADRVVLDLTTGKIAGDFQIEILGDDGDLLEVKGSGGADTLCLDGDVFTCGGSPLEIHLAGVSQVAFKGGGGNDSLKVLGDQTGRQITLAGDGGNDTYAIGSSGGEIRVQDSSGNDKLNFAAASESLTINLSRTHAEVQDGAAGNSLALVGTIECVIGTPLDDEIVGNAAHNVLRGGEGNDLIRGGGGNDNLFGDDGDDSLFGEAGNDCLFGGDGDDITSGGAGVDKLQGAGGFDLLLGGAGFDMLDAKDGDNLVVSGRTVFDNDQAVLLAILAEWASGRDLAARIANLTDGSGSPDRENDDFFLTSGPGGTLLSGDPINLIYTGQGNWLRPQPRDIVMRR